MKYLNKDCDTKLLYQTTWLVENTVKYRELTICPCANLIAPEGKCLSLIVNGIGHDIVPGTYTGDVVLSVSDSFPMTPHALMIQNDIARDFSAAVVVDDKGADVRVPDLISGGTVADEEADGIYIGTTAQSYNGIIVGGGAVYTVKNAEFDFEGFSNNDFMGVGVGVTAIDQAKVNIEDSTFNFSGVTRCAVHAGGESEVTVDRCDIINISPDSDWVGDFSWQIALLGTNRLVQLADGAKATYNDCRLISNGWGITSIDGTNAPVELNINRCDMRLIGPRSHGYGAFCIGGNAVTIRDSSVHVNGYPMLVMGMENKGRPSIIGSKITGRRFGAMVYSDSGSVFQILDSQFTTGKSSLVVKGSNTTINIDNTIMTPGNGVVLQLMDNDECGMAARNFVIPVGRTDTPIEGRDLTEIDPEFDVVLNITNSAMNGSFYNSSTNLHPEKQSTMGSRGIFHDTMVGLPAMDDHAEPLDMPPMPKMKDNRGPKNVEINLKGSTVSGVISSAAASYREGLKEIGPDNRLELSNITQTAAPAVNNGMILSMDSASVWTVTGTSYLTRLSLEEGTVIRPADGKALAFSVDGYEMDLVPGTYQGDIRIIVK